MAIKSIVKYLLVFLVFASASGLVVELQQKHKQSQYNQALADADYVAAAEFGGDHGRFAEAFGQALVGEIDDARVVYGDLGRSTDTDLRAAAFYNLGNSYMKQAETMDLDKDADRAFPLIELAKMNYRKALAINSENWDARRNLQRALRLVPDANPKVPMEVQGRPGAVRTVTSADSEKNFP